MCLLVLAWKVHPQHDLVVAANRDERHDRPTGPLERWPDQPHLAAGRDLAAAGTWLAMDAAGRFAAVTNFRDESSPPARAHSRGDLVTAFLAQSLDAAAFARRLESDAHRYAGFNLLLGDAHTVWYLSNRSPQFAQPLPPGIHGLSNHLLGTSWPKLDMGLAAMRTHVDQGGEDTEPLFDVLARREVAEEAEPSLPWPARSGPFIEHPAFGTRSSAVLRREHGRLITLEERRFGRNGAPGGSTRLSFPLASAA